MSKKSFCVFGAENYIQKEIVHHLQNSLEEGEAYLRVVYSTENHGQQKEGKITKIINKQKPKLFKKYIQKSNHIFIDLILNQQSQQDIDSIVNAIKTKREFEEDIHIIVISSLMSWNQTNPYLYYREKHPLAYQQYLKDHNMPDFYKQDIELQTLSAQDSQTDNLEKLENQSQNDTEEIKQEEQKIQTHSNNEFTDENENDGEIKKYIKLDPLQKKFFQYRQSKQEYENIKNQENQLAELHTVNEKVKVYILYAGLLYGRSQMFLKDYFNKAFLQRSLSVHYDQNIQNYNIPLFSVTNIPQTILRLIEKQNEEQEQEEQKSVYYGEEQTLQEQEDKQQEQIQEQEENQEQQEEEQEQKIPGKLYIEFLTENETITHKEIIQTISEHFGNGKLIENIKYKYPKDLLTDFQLEKDIKFQEIIKDDKNFKQIIQQQIVDYMIEENLSPIRIFYYCLEKDQKVFCTKLSQTYNVRTIDCENFLLKLYQLQGFQVFYDNFTKKDIQNFDILLKSDIKSLFDNPQKNKKLITFYIKLLKVRLSLNDCKYKGFVLIYKNYLVDNIQFQQLFYKNSLSSSSYLKELKKNKKAELKNLRKLQKQKQKNKKLAEEKYQKLLEEQEQQDITEQQQNKDQEKTQQSKSELSYQEEDDQERNEEQNIQIDKEEVENDDEKNDQEEVQEDESQEEEEDQKEEEQEQSDIKTREEFFPDHFILLFTSDQEYEYIQQVQNFCIQKEVKFYTKKLKLNDFQNEERQNQIFHLMRIYLNRNLDNQPIAMGEDNFQKASEQKMQKYIQKISASQQVIKITNKYNRQSMAQLRSQQFQDAIKYFHQFQSRESEREIEESKKYKNNREILTKIFYEVLYEGLLNIKKLDPSDPFEYLSDFIYEKSFEEN